MPFFSAIGLKSFWTTDKEIAVTEFSIFGYLYRDASNYKAWGSLLLEEGSTTTAEVEALRATLDSDEFSSPSK